jgi:universal stress protein A
MPTIKRILCPVDFSDTAAVGAREAAALARAAGAELLLVHALHQPWPSASREKGYPAPIAQQYEMIARCKLQIAADALHQLTRVRPIIVYGPADDAIAQTAAKHDVDLIVMGARTRRGLSKLLTDGMTERVMKRSRVPVVRVCPAAHRKPRTPFATPHGLA